MKGQVMPRNAVRFLMLAAFMLSLCSCAVEFEQFQPDDANKNCQSKDDCEDGYDCVDGACTPVFNPGDSDKNDGDSDTVENDKPDGDSSPDGDDSADGDGTPDGDESEDGDDDPGLCAGVECEPNGNPCAPNICDPADGQCRPVFDPNGVCTPDVENPCVTVACSEELMACEETPNNEADCDDGNLCTGVEFCYNGTCQHEGVIQCNECQFCNPESGECECKPGDCDLAEFCNGEDDNCNDEIDEDDVCENPGSGLRIELRWSRQQADLDLHVVRPGGGLGGLNLIDNDDCYYNNVNPNWGSSGSSTDNPVFGDDIHNGGGSNWQSMTPEIVTLANPKESVYRAVVHYASGDNFQQSTDVSLKVFMDDNLVATHTVSLQSRYTYWNVSCISYDNKTATLITDEEGDPEVTAYSSELNADACLSSGLSCSHLCDCPQGMGCVDGLCAPVATPVYCCNKPDCKTAKACEYRETVGEVRYCGGRIEFDTNAIGEELGDKVNVNELYNRWGVIFKSTDTNCIIATDNSLHLDGISEGLCASSMNVSNGQRWRSDIVIHFIVPNSNGTYLSQSTTTDYAYFNVGQTFQNGLHVRAYNINGFDPGNPDANKVLDDVINASGWVQLVPYEPMSYIWIDQSSDHDFVIDDFTWMDIKRP